MSEAEQADRPEASRIILRRHLRYSILVGAAIGLLAAGLILWGAIDDNLQLEFYDPGTGEIYWGYIFSCFLSIFVWFLVGGMAVYWVVVLLGRAVDAWAAPRGPRNQA